MSELHKQSHQGDRVVAIIVREAAQFIAREAVPPPAGGSLITVIRGESVAHGDRVNIFISVFPTLKAPAALAFLERQREAFSEYLKTRTAHLRLPRIEFLLDNQSLP